MKYVFIFHRLYAFNYKSYTSMKSFLCFRQGAITHHFVYIFQMLFTLSNVFFWENICVRVVWQCSWDCSFICVILFADHLIISMHTPYAYVLVKWFYILLASIYFTSYFVNDIFINIIFLISDNCNVRTAWTCLIEFQHQIQKEWRQSRWCEYWTIVSNFVMDDCKLSVTLNLDLVLS